MRKKIKKFLKQFPLFYKITSNTFWVVQGWKEKIFGTQIQEKYWERRQDDWGKNKDWVMGYWNSRFHPHRQILMEEICQHSFKSILEIGSNCGPNLYLLAKKKPEAEFVGIDINKKAVKVGNALFAKEGIPNVTLKTLKADELECFGDKSFDIVFTDATLLYIGPDKIKKVASEMQRIAKTAVIILEHHSERESALGKYNKGNWLRNYRKLFQSLGTEIKTTKISPEIWGGDWGRLGCLIEVLL